MISQNGWPIPSFVRMARLSCIAILAIYENDGECATGISQMQAVQQTLIKK